MAGIETPSLYNYLQDTQLMLADTGQSLVNPGDLGRYVNRARREVAMRSQSVRILSPVEGEINAIEVIRPGRGYRDPQVHISFPDAPSGEQPDPGGRRARAYASHIGGRISNIAVEDGGSGYFQPVVRVWDKDEDDRDDRRFYDWEDDEHERAVVKAHTVPILVTRQFQEVYPFKSVPLQRFPGVAEIFAVKSMSFRYMNYRYSIPVFAFSVYQAYVRIYPQQYLYVPTAAAQYGQGTNGSVFMYPIPSHMYQMEWDCFCLPQDLDDDQDYEAIPKPWTDAVPYFAAHLAYLGFQNHNAAQYYLNLYDDMVRRYSAYARPGRAINPYGRWAAFT